MTPRIFIACVAVSAAMSAPIHVTEAQAADTLAHIAFTNATVIDGTGTPPAPKQTILVNRGKIEDVFETGSRALPAGVRVVDLTGKFVIPGLIDAHVHVATDPAGQDANAGATLHRALLGGLTSVRDMAGDAIVLKEIATQSRRADADIPRLFYSSLMAGPSFLATRGRERRRTVGRPANCHG